MARHVKRSGPVKGSRDSRAKPRRRIRWGHLILLLGGFFVLAVGGLSVDLIVKSVQTLPSLTNPAHPLGETSVIYDAAGQPVVNLTAGYTRDPVPLSQIPKVVQNAFIAAEDHYFYQDSGFSLRGILRAAVHDVGGGALQGGSTITQQLAKDLYLTRRDTLTRKIKEAILGIELARHYTHPEILDMYLNEIYLGGGADGVQAASLVYFGKSVWQLDLAQAALLAGLPPAPSAYDPQVNFKLALVQQKRVLGQMETYGYITAAQEKAALAEPLNILPAAAATQQYPYPWFTEEVIQLLQSKYHFTQQQIYQGGLKIYTTLVPSIYNAAQAAVTKQLNAKFPLTVNGKPVSDPMQAAVVMMNQANGNVVALIGGRQFTNMFGQNLATQAEEQTGSSIKPLVDYIPALEKGYTAGTTVNDVVKVYNLGAGQPLYIPRDYTGVYNREWYYGPTTFTEALRRSVNSAAVQVLNKVGIKFGVTTAQKLGLVDLSIKNNDHLSVALGGTVGCCTPLEMADAYATIANGGRRVAPRFITKVFGPNGNALLNVLPSWTPVLDPRIAYVMTKMLETVDTPQANHGWDQVTGVADSNWGTGYDGQVQDNVTTAAGAWPMAAKTGTTNSDRQVWYLGFTPLYTGAVYLGENYPTANPNAEGGTDAGPILKAVMTAALQGKPVVHFTRPPGVVEAPIDIYAAPWHVAKPGPLTPPQFVRNEWFVAGTQPTQVSSLWEQVQIDPQQGNSLWRPGCTGQPVTQVYLNAGTQYTQTWAQGIAQLVQRSDWQQFIPVDVQMGPPTTWCQGPGLPPTPPVSQTPQTSQTSATSATSQASQASKTSQTSSGTAPAGCQSSWTITVSGETITPNTICVLAGKPAQLTFSAADNQTHVIALAGYGQEAIVSVQGPPVTQTIQPQGTAPWLIVDAATRKQLGQIRVVTG